MSHFGCLYAVILFLFYIEFVLNAMRTDFTLQDREDYYSAAVLGFS
jgi:hypothetical protein